MRLYGEINLPGDKSISHRSVMLNALAYGNCKITNFLFSEDCLATITILKALGVKITQKDDTVSLIGNGYLGFTKPKGELDCMNSGTTARFLMGMLSGLEFESTLIGDDSLSRRPMKRVSTPLKLLNANIELTNDNYLPTKIIPSTITNNEVSLSVASAQVKSAVLLAALKSKEKTIIHEKAQTRNHTELMLKYLGADITVEGLKITISGKNKLTCRDIIVPGDISSAAFFIVAALVVPNSEIVIKNCGLNTTRTGIIRILEMIDADYTILNKRVVCEEVIGDLQIKYKEKLSPFTIEGDLVPLLIDEIPILTLLATQINGISHIKDATELRVKESDRIKTTSKELNKLNANVIETNDGMIIYGKTKLLGATVDSFKDHRISMMLKVASLICEGMTILNRDCDRVSFPNFENEMNNLLK